MNLKILLLPHTFLSLGLGAFLLKSGASELLAGTGKFQADSNPRMMVGPRIGAKHVAKKDSDHQIPSLETAGTKKAAEDGNKGPGATGTWVPVQNNPIPTLPPPAVAGEYSNPLGMRFVKVPGTPVLMCVHETRNKDYAVFAKETNLRDGKWKRPEFLLSKVKYNFTDDHDRPVIHVSWEDAVAFCTWLGRKDGKTYRLPTDHEWSCAVGIGDKETASETPKSKDGKVPAFPWGTGYPPPKNHLGNYWDSTAVKKGEAETTALGSYDDGHLLTSPVMTYPANKLGLHDLGGNVWEWCQDLFEPGATSRVLRGASWYEVSRENLASSFRISDAPTFSSHDTGFRCVMVIGSSP